MKVVYTEIAGKELFEEDKGFYAESYILDSADTEVYELEVEDTVGLQIQYETDGIKVYMVHPEQVLSIKQI